MDKPATGARYSLLRLDAHGKTGVALVALLAIACARAQPPTTLAGPIQTNAEDRALARLVALSQATFDELDPIARDEAGAPPSPVVWPPSTQPARIEIWRRLDPVRARLDRTDPEALSPPWQATSALLQRRVSERPLAWDALSLQALVGRGLWASLGPEAQPSARSAARLDALGIFLATARTATVAAPKPRLDTALNMLQAQRSWVANLQPLQPDPDFENVRDLAVAALDVHELHLQDNLLTATATIEVARPMPWDGRWLRVPEAARIEDAADAMLYRVQNALLALFGRAPLEDAKVRADVLDQVAAPGVADDSLDDFLVGLNTYLSSACPPAPVITATAAPMALRGLAAVRLDTAAARTSTTTFRLWLSVTGSPVIVQRYPTAKQMALALYEGWPGRALHSWATTTRSDRGTLERRWPDPVLTEGWPLFALDRLIDTERLPQAVQWHRLQLLLRAVVDAQVDLWAQRQAPPDDQELLTWLTEVGRQTPAEARYKLTVAKMEPGRLTAPFLGWWTLTRLADRYLPTPDFNSMRRFAACTEWPPDLLPACLNPQD